MHSSVSNLLNATGNSSSSNNGQHPSNAKRISYVSNKNGSLSHINGGASLGSNTSLPSDLIYTTNGTSNGTGRPTVVQIGSSNNNLHSFNNKGNKSNNILLKNFILNRNESNRIEIVNHRHRRKKATSKCLLCN